MTRLLLESSMITGFVAAMMLLIEYVHVVSQGKWSNWLARGRMGQYVLVSLLGAMPGCLGAFTVVSMYAHGVVSLGAVVAAMLATSGDEAFVMFAMIPRTALLLTIGLFVLAVLTGMTVDLLLVRRRPIHSPCPSLLVHAGEQPMRLSAARVLAQWKDCSAARGVLTVSLILFAAAIAGGRIGPEEWNWIRVSLLAVSGASLFVVITVPDHFLEEHLWKHVARKHAPRVFLWTFGALAASGPLEQLLKIGGGAAGNQWLLLLLACLVGLIPESGPHLIFVTLYAQGAAPFGVLLASSIVQDGHGMLPMLAHSRRAFAAVKAINLVVGFAAGAAALWLGSRAAF
jgi:hypothetical protein